MSLVTPTAASDTEDRAVRATTVMVLPERSDRRWSGGPHPLLVSWLVLAIPLGIVLAGAWNYRWVQDDAFIDFRVVANLLAGHGPVFNVGERVEVYSDPLWVFLLAVMHEILPFLSLEWLSVLLGLSGTAAGVALGGRGMQRLGGRRHDDLVLPVGLLLFSSVAAVWEFSTSGLEMGMVFGWIGLSFWLLVRTESRRRSATVCAFVTGLGPLIRPELILVSGVFLVGLAFVIASPGWNGPPRFGRRWALPAVAALLLPAAYEVWRMAYFAMFVSNSELTKSGGGSDVPQGLTYFWNFVATYLLWIPLLLALPIVVPRIRSWWAGGDHAGTVVLVTPILAGAADALYTIRIGGDYMEGRLLLPAYLCWCLAVFVDVAQLRTLVAVPLVGLAIWSLVSVSWLRPDNVVPFIHNMHDERATAIADSGERHPIDLSNYVRVVSLGRVLESTAASTPSSERSMLVLEDPGKVFILAGTKPHNLAVFEGRWTRFVSLNLSAAHSQLPARLFVNLTSIGEMGYEAGSQVYIFDSLSLANPIGSHTTVVVRGIPGHEKSIGQAWMIARFGVAGESIPNVSIFGLAPETAAARKALDCEPLKSYLAAITKPLSLSQAFSNIVHSFTYTSMSFSPDPIDAEDELCGH